MENQQLTTYILAQLNAGLSSGDIVTQLRQAGWDEDTIQAGFAAVGASIAAAPQPVAPVHQPEQPGDRSTDPSFATTTPAEPLTEQPAQSTTLPPPIKRGRLKIGWLLFKQSLRIIKDTPALARYMIASIVASLLLTVLFVSGFIADSITSTNILGEMITTADSSEYSMKPLGYIVGALFIYLSTLLTYFFATALSAHVLAIFSGTVSSFRDNIALARTKLGAIALYSLITVTVGFILSFIEQRLRLIGLIISRLLGALWSLLVTFSIPIIADTDKNGASAVKESMRLFKANWGQTITGRVSVGVLATILYFLVMIPVTILLFILLAPFGIIGGFIALSLFFIGLIILIILEALATNVLNVCLYYYAKYNAVPPSFDPALLASVFTEKKKKK